MRYFASANHFNAGVVFVACGHQLIEFFGVGRVQPDAAMGGNPAQSANRASAVNANAIRGNQHQPWQAHVPLFFVIAFVGANRTIGPRWGFPAALAGGYPPAIFPLAIYIDIHPLLREIHLGNNGCGVGFDAGDRQSCKCQKRKKERCC